MVEPRRCHLEGRYATQRADARWVLGVCSMSLAACMAGREPAQFVAGASAPPEPLETPSPAGHSLLAIDPFERPYKVNVPQEYAPDGEEYRSRLRICVSEQGEVSSVDIIEPSIRVIDQQISVVIPRWRYHPYISAGHATPFCYVMEYRVQS